MTYGLTGFFVGAVTTVPIVALRLFPAPVRFSGLSFSYNVSYAIFGGLTPIVLTVWLRTNPMAPAYYVGGLALLGMALALVPWSDSYKTETSNSATLCPVMRRLTARKEWKLFAVLPKADRRLAIGWWIVLLLRGVLPAVFAIATGTLVGAVAAAAPAWPGR